MKIKLNKKLRIGLIPIFILIITISSFSLYNAINNPGFEEKTISLYNSNNQANIDYEIIVEPNILYPGRRIPAGETYIAEFVDSIKAKFNYEFSGDKDIELQGKYEIIANVSGSRRGHDEENVVVWEKDFPLVTNKTFSSKENNYSLSENLSIDYNKYNEFAKEALETSKVDTDVNLNVYLNVHIKGENEAGLIEETISSNLLIPLNTPIFEIEANNVEIPGAIEETIQVQLPVDKNLVILYGSIIGVCALGLIFLIFFTQVAPEKDALEKELDKIFKKHGDRLVALTSKIDISNVMNVRFIDDLVRLADEVNRPILYKYSKDYKEINKFFVTNDDEIYVFDLEKFIPREEVIIVNKQAAVDNE